MTANAHSRPAEEPLVVAIEMGYGHLRAARALADALGIDVLHVDRPPLAGADEQRLWSRVRSAYEWTSRLSQVPLVGAPLRAVLDAVTDIPHLHPYRDLSAPTRGALTLDQLIRRSLGAGLAETLRSTGAPLLTTFYSPAIAADRAGCERIHCVVTDSDINRIWVPVDPRRTRIRYLVPTRRAARRLRAYGVPETNIVFTGFPLPDELVGGPSLHVLQRNLAARLVRLDPAREFRRSIPEELAHFLGPLPEQEEGRPPLITFAVGGAGAQAGLVRRFLPGLRPALEERSLRLALVAGVRHEVAELFREAAAGAGVEGLLGGAVEIVESGSFAEYYARFNALLARTDLLWTKPSELSFYAALGLPLICAPPVGVHEWYNCRWVRDSGAGFKQRDPRFAGEWLGDGLVEGIFAAAAWAGFIRLPKFGLYRILDAMGIAARSGSPTLR